MTIALESMQSKRRTTSKLWHLRDLHHTTPHHITVKEKIQEGMMTIACMHSAGESRGEESRAEQKILKERLEERREKEKEERGEERREERRK